MSESERPDRLSGREITVEDIRALAGPSTPHFALQIRNRIERLIEPLPAGPPGADRGRAPDRAADRARPALGRAAGPADDDRAHAGRRPRARDRRCSTSAARRARARARPQRRRLPRPARATSSSRPGATQDLMVTRIVPAIYERYWRPALGRVFKGVTGPGDGRGDPDRAPAARARRGRHGPRRRLRAGQLHARVRPRRRPRRARGRDRRLADDARARRRRSCARADPGNLVLVRGDATALPFRDASFDGVCCFAALHLFADPFAALDEMRRVLTPGGRIALMTSVRREVTCGR